MRDMEAAPGASQIDSHTLYRRWLAYSSEWNNSFHPTTHAATFASPAQEELNTMATRKKPNIGTMLRKFVVELRNPTNETRRTAANRDLLSLMRDNIDNFYLRAHDEARMKERADFYQRMVEWLNTQGINEEAHQCKWCHTLVFASQRNHVPLWDAFELVEADHGPQFVCGHCAHYMRETRAYYFEGNRTIVPAETQIEGSILGYSQDATTLTTPLIAEGEHDPMMLGVELECVVRAEHVDHNWGANRVAQEFRSTAPWLITKADGSIAGAGFEIVTAPMSLRVHQFLWAGLFETDLMHKIRSDSSCGLHVHLSKKHMTALTLGKMAYFLNHSAHQPLVEAIAGRRSTTYARFEESLVARVGQAAFHRSDKYRVFNTGKPATVELRIGASTTNKEELLARIEFAHAVWAFCQQVSSARNAINGVAFCRFVKDEAATYHFLVRHLAHLLGGDIVPSRLDRLKQQLAQAGVHFQPKLPPIITPATALAA